MIESEEKKISESVVKTLPTFAIMEVFAALSAVSGDLATPLKNFTPAIFLIIILLSCITGAIYFLARRKNKLLIIWPILPILLCGFLYFKAPKAEAGVTNPGVIATALPIVETIQAYVLPLKEEAKQQLHLDVALKTGDDDDKRMAIEAINDIPGAAAQKALYRLAANSKNPDLNQIIIFQILTSQIHNTIPIELQSIKVVTKLSALINGAEFQIEEANPKGFDIRAQIHIGGYFGLSGKVSGSELMLSGNVYAESVTYHAVFRAELKPDLQMFGTIQLIDDQGSTTSLPIKIQPL